jgi:uncharacterized protein (TIGR00725 family)
MPRPVIGVMGASEHDALAQSDSAYVKTVAQRLGAAVARSGAVLITGATTGLPHLVSCACRAHGGLTLGVSPALNAAEHATRYGLPDDGNDVIIYTGFGLKGRNVVNVRSADVIILIGGATGTLNEFTIAYDEGKVIGVLESSGGVVDHIREIIEFCKKPTAGAVVFEKEPEALVETCLEALAARERETES